MALIGFIIIIKIVIFRVIPFIDQYLLMEETDLARRYTKGSWVMITGASSGMGEQFAYEFAKRGFNLLLLGSEKTKRVIKRIKTEGMSVEVDFIQIDFSKSFEESFFNEIQEKTDKLGNKWRILINNVGYRTACSDYRKMDISEMKKTIAVGTLVQSKLIQMAIQSFSKHIRQTAIVNITAQNSVCTDLFAIQNDISVPYLSCYEAANAYGYFHAKSIYEEIKRKYNNIDYLTITPGAVITKNTEKVLKDTIFAVDVKTFVHGIMKLIGNKNGVYCAHWGHSFCGALLNIFPFIDRESITNKVGMDFAKIKYNVI